MNTGFTGPTNHARARMPAFLGQNAHFQLSAHLAVFIFSTTLPRLNRSSLHLLGLSNPNIWAFSCVFVLFLESLVSTKEATFCSSAGATKAPFGAKSHGSLLTSAMAASNLYVRDAPYISQDIAYFVQEPFSTKKIFTFFWSALFNFLISTISLFFGSIERDSV